MALKTVRARIQGRVQGGLVLGLDRGYGEILTAGRLGAQPL